MYLFTAVMLMEARQYAATAAPGLLLISMTDAGTTVRRDDIALAAVVLISLLPPLE